MDEKRLRRFEPDSILTFQSHTPQRFKVLTQAYPRITRQFLYPLPCCIGDSDRPPILYFIMEPGSTGFSGFFGFFFVH